MISFLQSKLSAILSIELYSQGRMATLHAITKHILFVEGHLIVNVICVISRVCSCLDNAQIISFTLISLEGYSSSKVPEYQSIDAVPLRWNNDIDLCLFRWFCCKSLHCNVLVLFCFPKKKSVQMSIPFCFQYM